MVFVNLGYAKLDELIANGQSPTADGEFWSVNSSGKLTTTYGLDLSNQDIVNVRSILSAGGKWSIDENGLLVVQEIETERLTVKESARFGSAEKRIGITIYDKDTGAPYCMKVKNGALVSVAGECGAEQASPASVDGGGWSVENGGEDQTGEVGLPAEDPTSGTSESQEPTTNSQEPLAASPEGSPASENAPLTTAEEPPAEPSPPEVTQTGGGGGSEL